MVSPALQAGTTAIHLPDLHGGTALVTGASRGIGRAVVEALVAARSQRADSPLRFLTPRELDVLGAMAEGRNNALVASSLGLSERGVEKHINSIFSKLALSVGRAVLRRGEAG